MTNIDKAYKISKKLHSGQTDRAGKPYFKHIERVFNSVGGYMANPESLGIVALLHDSVEDTNISISQIEGLFGKEVSQAVNAITKKPNEDYISYLKRVKSNRLARKVKIADLKDNSNLLRISNPKPEDLIRNNKYKKALKYLK